MTQIWILHGHVVAPKYFYHETYQRDYRKMIIKSFAYNSFVKLLSSRITRSIPKDPKI